MATQERIARISLHPEGRTLPQSFIDSFVAPGGSTILQQCFGASDGAKCEARFVALSAQGPEALIVFHPAFTDVFFQDQDGKWSKGGRVDLPYGASGESGDQGGWLASFEPLERSAQSARVH